MAQEQKNVQEQDLNQLRKVRREKLAELQGSGKDPFVITKYDQTHHSVEVKENYEELEGKQVSIAGRMMSKRVMGKASFCNVQDLKGNIQSYVARDSIGEENYKEFKRFNGYANFVNPYVTYMSGLYLMTNGHSNSDYETASNYLKGVSGMVRHNKFVKQDLSLANKLASGTQKNLVPTAWVVFENGLVANFEEFRLDLPIFIATNNVKTASLALPYPKEREIAYKNISVSNGNKKVTTELLADIDNIFMAEFKKKLPIIVTKAVTKLTLQTVAQAVAQNEFGDLGGIAMSAYSVMTAGADTRSWYSLPKNVQLAKIAKKGTKLTLNIGGQDYKVEVPQKGNSIVYVRVPAAEATPVISVLDL